MAKTPEQLDKNMAIKKAPKVRGLQWHNATNKQFTTRGLWWHKQNKGKFRRLPLRAEHIVREGVWDLASHMAGARICFKSDTRRMQVHAQLTSSVSWAHMPHTGHSGIYLFSGGPHRMKPWNVAFPYPQEVIFEREFFSGASKKMREFTIYLPPYNGLDRLEIGLSTNARIEKPSPHILKKPVVFYGTSITQGGCIHTPGSDYPSLVGRALNLDIVNLGFSGNGTGEPEMAKLVSEIDASAFVLDYVANAGLEGTKKTLPSFYKTLRAKHPKTPIILITLFPFDRTTFVPQERVGHEQMRDAIIHFYSKMRQKGDLNIHFVDGNSLVPYGSQLAHADGNVHLTNVGFSMMAKALAPALDYILLSNLE